MERNNSKFELFEREFSELKAQIDKVENDYKIELLKVNKKLESVCSKVGNCGDAKVGSQFSESRNGFTDGNSAYITKEEWRHFRERVDENHERMAGVEYGLEQYSKKTDSIDQRIRKQNIIIDQLDEWQDENTYARINDLLDTTLSENDRKIAIVANAYRFGNRQKRGQPRKILLEMTTSKGKDIVLNQARQISKVGNNGRYFYLNEDAPDGVKRKKSDIYKYIRYMEDIRGKKVERDGEFLIIEGYRYHLNELNNLPPGDRLMDSRTRFYRGVVAFQSALSPLSNLFGCRIRFNGHQYNCTEQAYQYAKCIHHGLTKLARDIKFQQDPYVIAGIGNSFLEDDEWSQKKVGLMEQLLRHKYDQVPIFRDMLRNTESHYLVENTWSDFWGSACPFVCNAVWDGTFRGQNHLGKLLERIRDSC